MAQNKINFSGMDAGTVARTAVLILALTNQALTMMDRPIIPIENDDLSNLVTLAFTVGASLLAWWNNNSLTDHAQQAEEYRKCLKHDYCMPVRAIAK